MNRISKFLTRAAVALAVAVILPSCAMEEPFGEAGEGALTINTEMRGDIKKVTRADIQGDELASLREKCVVYIENSKGVIRKFKGVDNIPQQIYLKTGNYVAEAWSGDSVSASFDKKFYRGYETFEMGEGQNELTLRCNIANVLVSVDPSSLDVSLKDLKVTFSHSRGELVFDSSNIDGTTKGYFMMPNADKDLSYKIEGTKSDGSAYLKEGKIENVQRAHEYSMKITEEPGTISEGGALIRITIADIPLIEEEFEILPAPAVRGVGFDNEEQIVSVERSFSDVRMYMRGYGKVENQGLASVMMTVSDNFPEDFINLGSDLNLSAGVDVIRNGAISALRDKGIDVEIVNLTEETTPEVNDGKDINVTQVYVTFKKAFLDALPVSDKEYTMTFEATDGFGKSNTGSLRIVNSEAAIEHLAPIGTAPAPDTAKEPMAVLANKATITGFIYDETATGVGIKYREQGTSDWNFVAASSASAAAARRQARINRGLGLATRANSAVKFTVEINNLKPGTTYEYKTVCDTFESEEVNSFTTESVFSLYNASFENWSSYSAKTMFGTKTVIFPGTGERESNPFWESGNEGAATASMVLTDKSTDMVHSGTYSARLESKSAMGMIAAGNIFVGKYARTDGTNGVLELGRPYNGSHPSKLRVYVNYRPASGVSVKSGNESFIPDGLKGGSDHGQIYVALTTGTVEIRTNPSDRKLFDKDNDAIAYGQVSFTEAFGPDGSLQLVEIPLEYNDKAKTTRPTHVVIVASASKYGDYFAGAKGSVMYLDDFELVYE